MKKRRQKSHQTLLRLFRKTVRYLRCNNQKRLFYLLKQSPELLIFLEDGVSLLQTAAWRQQYGIVLGLLRLGAKPDLVPEDCNTPLIHASADNDVTLARMLLDFGADLEKPNERLETPLGFACAYDALDVVRLLCERGAYVNGTEDWGHSYLWGVQCKSATNARAGEIEQILLAHGARVIIEEPKLPPRTV